MHAMAEIRSDSPFFAGLDDEAMALVAGCATNVHLAADEFLFREGQPAERFFLVRCGRVALEVNAPGQGRVVLDTVDDGDVAGWSWLVPPYQGVTDARAVVATSAAAIDGASLRGKRDRDPVRTRPAWRTSWPSSG